MNTERAHTIGNTVQRLARAPLAVTASSIGGKSVWRSMAALVILTLVLMASAVCTQAATVQVTVGQGGLEFTPRRRNDSGRRHGRMDICRSHT